MTLVFSVQDQVAPADAAAVDAGLDAANLAAGPLADVRRLAAMAHAPDGRPVGGAVGRTWGECCELQQLWVSAEYRRQGVGRRLLRDFEQRARARGCRLVYLDTFSFQAPRFYRAHGYTVAFEVRGYTQGVVKHTMTKVLGPGCSTGAPAAGSVSQTLPG